MRLILLPAMFIVLTLAGCSNAATGGSESSAASSPPAHDAAIVIPEVQGGKTVPGAIIEVIYPGGELRGIAHHLQQWDGTAWRAVSTLFVSWPDHASEPQLLAETWAPASESIDVEAIGFSGSGGGQFTVIPPPTPAGTYRICGDHRGRLCSAAFQITD